MANWRHRVNFAEEWRLAEDRSITVQELCKRIVPKLQILPYYENDWQFDDIVSQLEDMIEHTDYTYDDFDQVLHELYDWGDWDHRLWIETIITPEKV